MCLIGLGRCAPCALGLAILATFVNGLLAGSMRLGLVLPGSASLTEQHGPRLTLDRAARHGAGRDAAGVVDAALTSA
jgi:hypothetical protein